MGLVVFLLEAAGVKNLEEKDDLGKTPLFKAVEERRYATIRYLVHTAHADLYAFNDRGETVLHVASCWNGVVPMVRFLVKQCGMAIDTTNCKEQTALHLTTMSTKNSSAVSWLVTTGQASVNATDMDGETALHYTALYNNVSTARILLRHGASVEARTQRGETTLGIACRQGHTELCRVLVESGNANIHAAQCPSQQGSLLHAHLSAPASNLAMIEFLIEKGVNVYAVDDGEWNETALHLAIRLSGSSMDIVRALVQAGGARLVQAVGGF